MGREKGKEKGRGDKPEGWWRKGLGWTTDTEPGVSPAGYHETVGIDTELGQTPTNRLLKHYIRPDSLELSWLELGHS